MKDDELRAFLESATVGGESDKQSASNEPVDESGDSVVLPSAPNDEAPTEKRLSFDELIDQGLGGSKSTDDAPIVLPGPGDHASKRGGSLRSTGGLPPTEPIVTPPAAPVTMPAQQRPEEPPATEPAPVFAKSPTGDDFDLPPTRPVTVAPITPDPIGLGDTNRSSEPFAESDDDYEKIAVTGGSPRTKHLIPWIIVAAGAVVALIAAFFIVTSLTSGSSSNEADGSQSTSTEGGSTTSTSDQSDSNSGSTETKETTKPTQEKPTSQVPTVDVGPTMNMPIQQWGVQVDLSQKLGDTYYQITGENIVLTSSLITSLPPSCAGDWGMTRLADGGFEVLKPAERCADAPEVYDELWGLMDAMVQTARPL